MRTYPKINTLYKREFTTKDPITGELKFLDKGKSGNKIIEGDYACREFGAIRHWTVTEKVDGTNIRIGYKSEGSKVIVGGRNADSGIPTSLAEYLYSMFTTELFKECFPEAHDVQLFGEGVGGKIQCRPGQPYSPYGKDMHFILFDAIIDGWWLDVSSVKEIADRLGIMSAPLLEFVIAKEEVFRDGEWRTLFERTTSKWTENQIVQYIRQAPKSTLTNYVMEGIVARSAPMMMFRDRSQGPIMFKLKVKDFA